MFQRIAKFILKNALIAIVSTTFAVVGITFFLIIILAGFAAKNQNQLPKNAVLVFDLSMNVVDTPPVMTFEQMIVEALSDNSITQHSIRDLIETIERAKTDKRVKGILLQGSFIPSGYGSNYPILTELRDALVDFKESDKPLIAYSVTPSLRDLYVMSVADEFYLNQSGAVQMPGLYSERMFYKNALEKFGIGVQAVRVGDYKSGIEPYTRENMSEEAREATELLLADLWQNILSEIADARGINADKVQGIIDSKPILFAEEAVEAGLCDQVASHIEVRQRLFNITGQDEETISIHQIGLSEYIDEKDQFKGDISGTGVAVVYAEGAIVGGEGEENQAGARRIVRNLREARLNPDVKAVVLRVNSPGGGATASKIIQDELLQIREQGIPLIVSMGGYAASGGYLISQSADHIVSHPHTITGSIGIYGVLFNIEEGAAKLGITFDDVKTTANADIMSVSKPKTEEQLGIIQDYMDHFYADWTATVASYRNQSEDHIRSIASGRVWSGAQAIDNGLVDELGTLSDAIAIAANKAELGESYTVYDYPRKLTPDEALVAALGLDNAKANLGRVRSSTPTHYLMQYIEETQALLNQFNDPLGAYTHSPLIYR